jgi:hypothetical protein
MQLYIMFLLAPKTKKRKNQNETYRSLHFNLSVHVISLRLSLLPQNLFSHNGSALHFVLYARGNGVNHRVALGLQVAIERPQLRRVVQCPGE